MNEKPIILYDGQCSFCRFWIKRWLQATKRQLRYLPYQNTRETFSHIPERNLEKALHFIYPSGRMLIAAEAVFETFSYMKGFSWLRSLYIPNTKPFWEWSYRLVASHRRFFSFLTTLFFKHRNFSSYTLSKLILGKGLAIIYIIAFLSLLLEVKGLFGTSGIMPVKNMIALFLTPSKNVSFFDAPNIFYLNQENWFLLSSCLIGILAGIAAFFHKQKGPFIFICWIIYSSFLNVGAPFLGFQWDALLCELGFLSLFLLPWRSQTEKSLSRAGVLLLKLLLFRLYFFSGLVKLLSGDLHWRHLTALDFHFYTQPLPHVFSWFWHQLPPLIDQLAVLGMFGIELIMPFFIFFKGKLKRVALIMMMLLQGTFILSGNFTFFNLLCLVLCLVVFNDEDFRRLFYFLKLSIPQIPIQPKVSGTKKIMFGIVLAYIGICSVLIEKNRYFPHHILLTHQLTRPLQTINSLNNYGLFASMTTVRKELEVLGSADGKTWKAYTFKYKPSDLKKQPTWIQPLQPRLDWQLWFVALRPYEQQTWLNNLLFRLFQNQKDVLGLFKENPFPISPPKYLQVKANTIQFTTIKERLSTGQIWKVIKSADYSPILSIK